MVVAVMKPAKTFPSENSFAGEFDQTETKQKKRRLYKANSINIFGFSSQKD
jgi:hypothetical protein